VSDFAGLVYTNDYTVIAFRHHAVGLWSCVCLNRLVFARQQHGISVSGYRMNTLEIRGGCNNNRCRAKPTGCFEPTR
jgi:hypothetical protein